ncbi:hypothetical protein EWM62_06570 [Mucilaginibacter terrigena]|uniref:Uncharacterized protein n=1 Tax=Mucilaginibacter terrigena TaxID=2492395 RepID=A0A4Q5LQH5_9SPHI|nr:hypothetical protein [Mucilaginibacter terrigena]RYU91599.1 hypothetical protein EWM62_06570 [Mucilaginibacter terrigena]
MNDLRNADQLRTNELFIARHGFWKPEFELTDGQFVYAKLSYRSNFKRDAIIELPQNSWTIKRKGWFNRTLLLNRGEDEPVGNLVPEIWKRDFNLLFDTGFEATYLCKKLFSKSITLTNSQLGDILHITQKPFAVKQPFTVTIALLKTPENMPPLPLLIMIGLHVIMLRQKQAAAH